MYAIEIGSDDEACFALIRTQHSTTLIANNDLHFQEKIWKTSVFIIKLFHMDRDMVVSI